MQVLLVTEWIFQGFYLDTALKEIKACMRHAESRESSKVYNKASPWWGSYSYRDQSKSYKRRELPKPSDSKRYVSSTPMALHQLRKLAVLSLAKKDPDGASFLHGTFLIGKFWQGKKTKSTSFTSPTDFKAYLQRKIHPKFRVQEQLQLFFVHSLRILWKKLH